MAGSGASVSPKFMENLPDGCPPPGAAPFDYEFVYRFVKANPATDDDFASGHALEQKAKAEGKQARERPRGTPPCIWAATSLWQTKEAANVVLSKLPKLRGKYKLMARVKITKLCGVSVLKRSHISFWRYATYKPQIIGYEAL